MISIVSEELYSLALFLPQFFAWYMAVSAYLSSELQSSPSSGYSEMPMLAVTKISCASIMKGRRMASLTRCATFSASSTRSRSGINIVNSSPPRRARLLPPKVASSSYSARSTRSLGRMVSRRRSDTTLSKWSPTSWPRVSLMRLKASRSMNSTANFLSCSFERTSSRSSVSRNACRLGMPVRLSQ
ncbi:hypothetical protein D3C72_1470340 [compost metagenome]